MQPPNEPKRYLDDPDNVARLWRRFVLVCVIVAALDLLGLFEFVYHRHELFFAEGLPGFYSVWGFMAIAALIFLAKQLRRLVMRPENYYEAGDDAD